MKKNIQTKTLSVALGAAMIAGLMTGCGVSTSSEDSTDSADVTEEAKVTEEASEETSDTIVAATSDDAAEATATEATAIDMTGRTEVEFWFAGGKTAAGVIKNIVDDFKPDVIELAGERCRENRNKVDIRYINGILNRWHNDGLMSTESVYASEQAYADKKQNEAASAGSFDAESWEDMVMNFDPSVLSSEEGE